MTDTPQSRRRWINMGEIIALLALVVSAAGLWLAWESSKQDGPTRIVEQRQSVPLTLRGKAQDDGKRLVITPVEAGHAIESLTLTIKGAQPIEIGSDGELSAKDLEAALKPKDEKNGAHSVPMRIAARYVEAGADRRSSGTYMLRYRWEGGGLFNGRSLRLTGFGR